MHMTGRMPPSPESCGLASCTCRRVDLVVPDVPVEVKERKIRMHYRHLKHEQGDEEAHARSHMVPVIVQPDTEAWTTHGSATAKTALGRL